ncbi:NAD(P)/FAD-dependent oxidoreductase [Bacteroidota bacterium]
MNSVVIIGAGPAGLSTAIQLKRYNIEPLLFEKNLVGGLLRNANLVENYPGFVNGISGVELVNAFSRHLDKAGIKINYEEVKEVDHCKGEFFVKTNSKNVACKIIVLATGTKPKVISSLKITSEISKLNFYEIYPIRKARNKEIAIIGAGDAAFDYALNLARFNKVTIFNRGHKTKCLPLLWERALKNENIIYLKNIAVKNIKQNNDELVLSCCDKMGEYEMTFSYLVIAIGRSPNLNIISTNLKRNLVGLQKSKYLFIIGDARNDMYRQTAIAAGDGIKTAMKIYRKLNRENS